MPKQGNTIGKNVFSHLDLGEMCGNIERYFFSVSLDEAHFFTLEDSIMRKCLAKIVCIVLVLMSVLFVFTACNKDDVTPKEISIEDALVGKWTAKANQNKNEAVVVFERDEVNKDKLIGNMSFYDFENKKWEGYDFTVKEIKEFIIILLLDNGNIETSSFAVSKDTLIIFNAEFKNKDKNIPVTRDDTYLKDGVIMPIVSDVFLGMTEEEFEMTEFFDKYQETGKTKMTFCKLPEWFVPKVNGFTSIYFNHEEILSSLTFCFWYYSDDLERMESVKKNLINSCNSLYGTSQNYSTNSEVYGEMDVLVWVSGNMYISIEDDKEDTDIRLEYSLHMPTGYTSV